MCLPGALPYPGQQSSFPQLPSLDWRPQRSEYTLQGQFLVAQKQLPRPVSVITPFPHSDPLTSVSWWQTEAWGWFWQEVVFVWSDSQSPLPVPTYGLHLGVCL